MSSQSINFDRAADYYDTTRGFPPGIDDKVMDFVARAAALQNSARLLEIGVGTGRIALPLSRHVGAICGVDISRGMMARLRERQRGEPVFPIQGDASALPFPGRSFDAVVIVHVLHLVADAGRVLGEAARVLKARGQLIHCFHNHENEPRMQALADAWRAHAPGNLHTNYKQVQQSLDEAGWRPVQETDYRYPLPTTPGEFVERISKRQWSSTWQFDEETLQPALAAMQEVIETHFGGSPDTVVENEGCFRIQLLALPEA